MKRWLISLLGGYSDVHEVLEQALLTKEDNEAIIKYAIEVVRDMPLDKRHVWLTMAVKRHFNTVGIEDILRVHESNQWLWQGKSLPLEKVKLLQAEARELQSGFLWSVIKAELRYQANRRMFINSVGEVDMIAGKLLVYYIDVIETRLKKMLEGK